MKNTREQVLQSVLFSIVCIYSTSIFVHTLKKSYAMQWHFSMMQHQPNPCMDPFLTNFDNILHEHNAGIVRACADDIGITLKRLEHLQLIHPIYSDCKELGGLASKPIKCGFSTFVQIH